MLGEAHKEKEPGEAQHNTTHDHSTTGTVREPAEGSSQTHSPQPLQPKQRFEEAPVHHNSPGRRPPEGSAHAKFTAS
eukprot:scaffold770_cov255-Pinguiococcus_pyrenoidosus.AAC.60